VKHIVIVTVEASQSLPNKELGLTDVLAQRAYDWCHANDCKVTVTATQCTQVPTKPQKWEIHQK
jgi:hypothetical protein